MVTVWRENAAVVYIERAFETKMSVTLSKEQAAVLLPLLPNLAGLVAAAQPAVTANSDGVHQQEPSYSVSEMFEKKKKNTRSTFAQNYLLVSILCSLVLFVCSLVLCVCSLVLFVCSSTRKICYSLL